MQIAAFSEKLNQTLKSLTYGDKPAELYEPIRYMMALGGKRIRPLLTLLSADLFDDQIDHVLLPAAAVEVFHNFTLMHDDIMDKAPLRRGKTTVHEKWNANTAILSGDVMLVKAYDMFLAVEPAKLPKVLQLFNKCAAEVCEGQQLDMNFEQTDKVAIEDYIRMITLKTAVLLGFALELGAVLNNASAEDAENIKQFGINTGIAFQLRDDLLDVYGSQESFGKRVGGDIVAGKKTFLMLTALEQAQSDDLQNLQTWLQKKDEEEAKVKAVTEIYQKLGIKEKTEQRINTYFQKALTHLENVNAPTEKKNLLKGLALDLMSRES